MNAHHATAPLTGGLKPAAPLLIASDRRAA